MENVKLIAFGISALGVWTTVATKYNKELMTQQKKLLIILCRHGNCHHSSNYARGLIKFKAPSSTPA